MTALDRPARLAGPVRMAPVLTKLMASLLLLLVGVACGDRAATSPAGKLKILTSVAPITNIAANVVGDLAEVEGLVPEGTSSHTFEPPPRTARALSGADILFLNGLRLEEPIEALVRASGSRSLRVVELGPRAITEQELIYDFSFPREQGKPNPHLWTDPTLAKRYAQVIKEEVTRADPVNGGRYESNFQAFVLLVDELDKAMRQSFATLAPEKRKLLTYHDAFAYFARSYGWSVLGAIQVSDFEDPSPKEVADLVDQVRRESVPVIFGSEVFPSPVLERIGRETGARYVDVLRDDDLPGEPGQPEHSWLGLMRFDFVTMVEALGGDASALRAVPVRNVAPDKAKYPQ